MIIAPLPFAEKMSLHFMDFYYFYDAKVFKPLGLLWTSFRVSHSPSLRANTYPHLPVFTPSLMLLPIFPPLT